jgi:hypothetical protein
MPVAEEVMDTPTKEMGHADVVGASARHEQGRAELPAYAQADFEKNLPAWRGIVEAGRKTPQALIDMLSTKAVLSDAQKAAIHKLAPIEAEQTTAAEQDARDAFVAEMGND